MTSVIPASLAVEVPRSVRPVINFSDRLSEGMYGIGGVAGLVIGNAVSSGPKSRLEAAFQASGLNIDKIAGDAFAGEIQRSGTFALANDGGDATLKVEVTAYGLEHPFTDSFTSGGAPVIGLEAEVVKNGQRDIGFSELLAAAQIARLPRLFCVQPENVAPIHACFEAGSETLLPRDWQPTIAEGTAIKRPVRLKQVLQAIRRSQGGTVAISEAEIAAAVRLLAAIGLYVEPTCATAAAAAGRLLASGRIRAGETSVVLLTGTGLKASSFMTELFAKG